MCGVYTLAGNTVRGEGLLHTDGLYHILVVHSSFVIIAMVMMTESELFPMKSSLLILVIIGFYNRISRKRQGAIYSCY